MPAFVDDLLNRITMYRLVLYFLILLSVCAFVVSFFGVLPFAPLNLVLSGVIILATAWLTNVVFAWAWDAPTNVESVWITALILLLIIPPNVVATLPGVGFVVFASVWAIASKFIVAHRRKHIFNPAAFGVALSYLALGQVATWWVAGNLYLLPVLFVGGVLIVRKIRRADLFWAFATAAVVAMILTGQGDLWTPIWQMFTHSAFFFLGFVMLTEPLTMPPSRWSRIVFGAIVGVLFIPAAHMGTFYFTPELALLMGNIFAWAVSPKGRHMLRLVSRTQVGSGVYDFAFAGTSSIKFEPGQYVEWTLPHQGPDARGNRRYFTIASSPTEETVHMGVKFYEPMSSFKRALLGMQAGDTISASHLSGDFVMPKDIQKKLVFIAGGIGVTPFRSMVQYMADRAQHRDIAMFYAAQTPQEFAYKEVFDKAGEFGLRTVYAASAQGERITPELIAKHVPDYRERTFYISGPRGMVESFKAALRTAGVPRWRIKTDYFPGFV